MTGREMIPFLRKRVCEFNGQMVAVNNELLALNTRIRELEKTLLLIMGQKNEAEFLLGKFEGDDHVHKS